MEKLPIKRLLQDYDELLKKNELIHADENEAKAETVKTIRTLYSKWDVKQYDKGKPMLQEIIT